MHWALPYVGLPWSLDGFGPRAFHCWGLVWHVQKEHFGREVPQYALVSPSDKLRVAREMDGAEHGGDWVELDEPAEGCVVGLSSHRVIHHVGVWTEADGGLVVHSSEGKGVLAQSLSALRANGYNRITFYAHRTWLTSLR